MKQGWILSDKDSAVFTSMKTIAMLMVLVIHSDLRSHGVAQNEFSDFYNQFFSLIVADGAVPIFFFISGFFLFRNYNFKKKLKSRIHTIFIPFFLWCLWGLFILFFLQYVLGLDSLFSGKELKLLRDFLPIDYLRVFWDIRNGAPITSTLWFLRDLCVMIIFSPLLYMLTKYKWGGYFVLFLFVLGFTEINNHVISWYSLFYFSAGGCIATHNVNLFKVFDKYSRGFWGGAIVALILSAVAYAYSLSQYGFFLRLWIVASIPVLYLICRNPSVYRSKVLAKLPKAAFFIYLFHEPMMGYIQKLFYKAFAPAGWTQYVLFWFFPLLALIISYIVFQILRRLTPNFLGLITGNR